jgi:hypothetical protein
MQAAIFFQFYSHGMTQRKQDIFGSKLISNVDVILRSFAHIYYEKFRKKSHRHVFELQNFP